MVTTFLLCLQLIIFKNLQKKMKHHLHSLLYCVLGGAVLLSGCNKEPKGGDEEVKTDFTFEALELTQGSFSVKISPVAKDQTYYFGIISKADYAQFASPEELQAADIARIKQIAESNGVDLEKFLMEALLKGEQTWSYTALAPETDYVFYAYGLSTDCQILTSLNTFEFKTPAVAPVDVTFKITPSDITPTTFTLNVEPSRDDVSYYYDVITPDQYNKYKDDLKSFVEAVLYEWKKTDKYQSYTMPVFIDEVTARGKIKDDSFKNLLPEGTYHAIAVAVANDGTCMSEVEVLSFNTSESPRNEYTVSSLNTTDVSCSAVISAKESEAFAVMMELKEYFKNEKGGEMTDAEIIEALYTAHNENISKYVFADAANVTFNDLIPNDDYYLLVFACNPNGSPKLDPEKVNLKKVDVRTETAKPSNADFTLKIMSNTITRNSVTVMVEASDDFKYDTFLINYVEDSEYQKMNDKEQGLKDHMDKFIDQKLKEYNDARPGVNMSRKEFLSRQLFSGAKGYTYSRIELQGFKPDTQYQVYLIGLKADGTYTTKPVVSQFKTISEHQCMASLEFIAQAYGFKDKKMDKYWVWTYPHGEFKEYYVKSFVGKDEWSGKSAAEVETLLKVDENKAPAKSNHISVLDVKYGETWYHYAVIYDNSGLRSSIYKLEHTSPENGDGNNDAVPVTVPVNVVELK